MVMARRPTTTPTGTAMAGTRPQGAPTEMDPDGPAVAGARGPGKVVVTEGEYVDFGTSMYELMHIQPP